MFAQGHFEEDVFEHSHNCECSNRHQYHGVVICVVLTDHLQILMLESTVRTIYFSGKDLSS
jgi:hypothetical protein